MSLVREQLVAVSCRELPWVARRQSKSCGNISVARARGNNTHARAYRRIIDQRWYGGIISLYHWNQSREIDTLSTPVHHLTTETREREEGCAVWTKTLWTTPPSQSAQVEVVTRCHVTSTASAVTWHPLQPRCVTFDFTTALIYHLCRWCHFWSLCTLFVIFFFFIPAITIVTPYPHIMFIYRLTLTPTPNRVHLLTPTNPTHYFFYTHTHIHTYKYIYIYTFTSRMHHHPAK